MTVDRLAWDYLLGNEIDGDSEVVSMTMVVKDADGNLKYYGVGEYGCFYKEE